MSKSSESITFVLFTFNEEKRIERAILNFRSYGTILVVDNQSTDRTRDIAMQYSCDVLINENAGWVEDEVTAARVKAAVKTEWIYWGFVDEMADARSMHAIVNAVESGHCDVVNVARKNYYLGQFCYDISADRMNRIFKKDSIDFTGNTIHSMGQVVPGTRITKLPSRYFIHHFISNTAKSYLRSMDRYTDIESTEGRSARGSLRLMLSTVKIIVVNLLLRGGYRAGVPGYFLVCQMVYYRWLSAMKIYEKSHNLDHDVVERKNDIVRDSIVAGLPRNANQSIS